jgi:hypothetical protein
MPDMNGRIVKTSNITPDPRDGNRQVVGGRVRAASCDSACARTERHRLPMVPFPELTDDEARAIFAYLRTVPPIKNAVARPAAIVHRRCGRRARAPITVTAATAATATRAVGLYDLRKGATDFSRPTTRLIAYIRHPEIKKPGVKMPTWDGVIAEEDYAPLAAYARKLGGTSR